MRCKKKEEKNLSVFFVNMAKRVMNRLEEIGDHSGRCRLRRPRRGDEEVEVEMEMKRDVGERLVKILCKSR